jgi:hypothetical protein
VVEDARSADRFKGLNGGSEVADYVLRREVRSLFGVLPRAKPVTAMKLTRYVRSRAIDAERLSLPLAGQIPACIPLPGLLPRWITISDHRGLFFRDFFRSR